MKTNTTRAAGYSPRVDALLDRLGFDLTDRDFAALAIACLDQAGVSARIQAAVQELVGEAGEDPMPIDGPARFRRIAL